MKIIFLLLGCVCIQNVLTAQTSQQQKIDSVCKLVKQYFNEKNASKVYELTGESFRKELSPEAFKNIFDNNLSPLGEMMKAEFESLANGVAKYKAVFSSMNLSLLLSLDDKEKLQSTLNKSPNHSSG